MNRFGKQPWIGIAFACTALAVICIIGVLIAVPMVKTSQTHQLSDAEVDQMQMQAAFGRDVHAQAQLRAYAQSGNPLAMRALGLFLLDRSAAIDQQEGLHLLTRSAELGNHRAQLALGKLYLYGSTYVPKDYRLALSWLSGVAVSAEDNGGAAFYLGAIYANGYGVSTDKAVAVKWFSIAAKKEIPAAMFMLANAIRHGEGIARNDTDALTWYVAAAELEHPPAVQTLAMIYALGEMGLKPDPEKAQHYMAEAAHALKHPALLP